MKRDLIFVLEDTEERVLWLQKIVEPIGYHVEWRLSVHEFLHDVYAHAPEIALVVFDHDLGHAHPNYTMPDERPDMHALIRYDQNGQDGYDAARAIGSHPVPALVWSWNSEGRRRIAHELADTGKFRRVLAAAFTASEEYAHAVRSLLDGAAR